MAGGGEHVDILVNGLGTDIHWLSLVRTASSRVACFIPVTSATKCIASLQHHALKA